MRKNGSIFDVIFFVILLFAIGLVTIFGSVIFNHLNENIQSSALSDTSKTLLQGSYDRYAPVMDGAILTLMVLLTITVVVLSYLVDISSIFAALGLLLVGMFIFVSGILSNTFESFVQNGMISDSAALFPNTLFIMSKLPLIVLGLGMVSLIVMYAKMRAVSI